MPEPLPHDGARRAPDPYAPPPPFAGPALDRSADVESPGRFRTRRDAGLALAQALGAYAHRDDVIVLALSASAVPVAHEVARMLHARLDLYLTATIAAPSHAALTVGVVTSDGRIVLSRELMSRLALPFALVRDGIVQARADLDRRERAYRASRARLTLRGRIVLLVCDGLVTGARMRGAAAAVRKAGATRVVAAAPVGAPEVCALVRRGTDECVCLHTPKPYYGAGAWYDEYRPPRDDEVRALLADAGLAPDESPSPRG